MNKTNVFVITREGKTVSKNGIAHLRKKLYDDFTIDTEIDFFSGAVFNDPMVLLDSMTTKENAYIVLSLPGEIILFPKEINKDICQNLKENKQKTSWQILTESCMKK